MTEKKKKTLLCDIDGILSNLHLAMIRRYNEKFGTSFTEEEIPQLFGDHELLTDKISEAGHHSIFQEEGFFKNIPLIKGAKSGLVELTEHFNIYIVTAPWRSNPYSFTEKHKWIEKHFYGLHEKIIFTSCKEPIHGDIFIDDRMKNLSAWKQYWPEGITASLKYHWTDSKVVDIVANDWKQLTQKIMDLK